MAAERQEIEPLARRLERLRRIELGLLWAAAGRLGPLPAALVAGRPGAANARLAVRRAQERFRLCGVVSAGWCGALDPALRVGQVVVADRVMSDSGSEEYEARPVAGRATTGPVLTVDHFVATAEEKRRLRQRGAVAVEMEAAAVAAEARRMAIPFFCVRAVSDVAEKTFRVDFNRARLPGGQFSTLRAAAAAGFSPGRWRELLQTWRDARTAAESLGEFLGSCRFEC